MGMYRFSRSGGTLQSLMNMVDQRGVGREGGCRGTVSLVTHSIVLPALQLNSLLCALAFRESITVRSLIWCSSHTYSLLTPLRGYSNGVSFIVESKRIVLGSIICFCCASTSLKILPP